MLNPGFGTIEEMSSPHIIDEINSSQRGLNCSIFWRRKGPGMAASQPLAPSAAGTRQFGATINFEAGTVRRAPPMLRSTGFEWLWRIKEEPYLWRRYWNDGKALLKLLVTCVCLLSSAPAGAAAKRIFPFTQPKI